MSMGNDNKYKIVRQIDINKNILFGKLSDILTHEVKINKWKEITKQLRALNIFNKDWKYLRDTTWQNLRKRTMKKSDRMENGSSGGKRLKYDKIDELILRIIGKKSEGISTVTNPSSPPTASTAFDREAEIPGDKIDIDREKREVELKLLKEKLEIAMRDKYKYDLELLKLERELQVQPSKFTKGFKRIDMLQQAINNM